MSTSSSKVVVRSTPTTISGEPHDSSSSSSISNITQAFPFSLGNPRIEETRGVMLLYRDDISPSVILNDGIKDRYSILIRFDRQDSIDNFYKSFNGTRFSSLELRDRIVYLEAGKTMEQLSMSDDIKGGTVLSIPTESSSRSGSKASNSRRS